MKHFNNLDLAWAAGIIDGEGSIMFTRVSRKKLSDGIIVAYPEIRVEISNYDDKMIKKIKQMFGGCYFVEHRKDRRKPIHRWLVACKMAEKVIRAVEPYLVTKKEQAKLALELRKIQTSEGKNGNKFFCRRSPDEWNKRAEHWFQMMRKLKI
jgi:hypothetical protein